MAQKLKVICQLVIITRDMLQGYVQVLFCVAPHTDTPHCGTAPSPGHGREHD